MAGRIYSIGQAVFGKSRLAQKAYFSLNNIIRYHTADFFSFIEFQTITTCNRRCHFCPVSTSPKKHQLMKMAVVEKLAADLKQIRYSGWISPHLYGEPLLDKRLEEITRIIHDSLPGATIVIYTNGDLLDRERFDSLVKAGMDKFIISQYDKEMPKAMSEFLRSLDKREAQRIDYRIVNDDCELSNRGGLVKPKKVKFSANCDLNSLFIDVDGNVILCSNDYFSSVKLGNVMDEDIVSIWNSERFKTLRKELRKGVYTNDICRKCKGL